MCLTADRISSPLAAFANPDSKHFSFMLNKESSTGSSEHRHLSVMHLFRTPVGGLFRHVCDLAREQCARGLDVGIVCDSSTADDFSNSMLARLAADCRLGVHQLPIRRTPGLSDVAAVRQIRRIAGAARPALLHGHGAKGAAYARMIAHRIGAKALYTPHGGSLHYSFDTLVGRLFLSIERLLRNRTDGFIFESDYSCRAYQERVGKLTRPFRVIHNGLFESEFDRPATANPEFDFVFIGELRALKGINVFLDAISSVSKEHKISVLIVGNGELEEDVRSRIAEPDLARSTTWSCAVHPASAVFAKARCIVCPSLAESLPYIILECLAAGTPVLATDVGGISEIFGKSAERLLPPGNAKVLATAMRQFLADPAEAERNARALRDHVRQHFLVSQMADATIDFYREITLETS